MMTTGQLVAPDGPTRPPVHALAARLSSLTGVRLGVLDNGKPNAGSLLVAIVDELVRVHGVREVVRHRKANPGMGADVATLGDLEACGAVIVGTGD